jgi:hypothetical protein
MDHFAGLDDLLSGSRTLIAYLASHPGRRANKAPAVLLFLKARRAITSRRARR